MKKALRETQTLCAGSSTTEPKIFAPPQTPSRGRGTAGDGHYLHLQTQFGEGQCTQFRVTVVTDPQTHTPQTNPQIGPITITLRRSVIRMALNGTHTSAKSPSVPFNSVIPCPRSNS